MDGDRPMTHTHKDTRTRLQKHFLEKSSFISTQNFMK